jgi:hypothetical protein
VLQRALSKVDDLDAEIRRVEDLRRTLLSIENPLSGHYRLDGGADLDAAIDNDLSYGSKETAARRRQEFYRKAGLRVKVGEALEISLGIGEGVSKHVTLSGETGRHKPGRVRGAAGGIPGQGG